MPHFLRILLRRSWLGLLLLLGALSGCRLYEPPRYERLKLAPGAPQTRILMIGDSLTYYNDLPGLLQQFSAQEAAPIIIEDHTTPLAPLSQHWGMGDAAKRIATGGFDYVILQDYSRKPVTDTEDCLKYFVLFDEVNKRAGGKTIVFQNWTRRDLESDYPAMEKTYGTIIDRTHARLAPIGAAWKLCAAERPDIGLLLDDRHPSDAGSYLAACVLYDVIYNKKSAVLPADLPGPKLPASVLVALRAIADRTVNPATP